MNERRIQPPSPSPLFRLIMIVIVILVTVYLCAGCSVLPDRAGLWAAHSSVPFRGMGPPPVGDHSASQETNWEAIEGTLTWDVGEHWQVQSSMAYVVHSNNLTAPDGFLFGCRVGREVRLTW